MRSHSARCGTLNRMTLLATRRFSVDHINAVIRVYDAAGCVINIQTEYEHRFLLPVLP
jgi:hypothetical protein